MRLKQDNQAKASPPNPAQYRFNPTSTGSEGGGKAFVAVTMQCCSSALIGVVEIQEDFLKWGEWRLLSPREGSPEAKQVSKQKGACLGQGQGGEESMNQPWPLRIQGPARGLATIPQHGWKLWDCKRSLWRTEKKGLQQDRSLKNPDEAHGQKGALSSQEPTPDR